MPGQLKVRVGGGFVPAAAAGGGGGGGSGAAEVWVGPNAPTGAETIWIDTDEAAPVPSDTRWDTAWGVVATGAKTAATVTVSYPAINTRLTSDVTFIAVAGRRYRLSLRLASVQITVGTQFGIAIGILEGSSIIGDADQWMWAGGSYSGGALNTHLTGDGAAHTVRGVLESVNSNPGTVVVAPSMLVVEDIGPVVGSIPAVGSPTTAWTSLPLGAGWSLYGGGYTPPQYRKIGDVVTLRGLAHSTTSALLIGTLPAGYRPPGNLMGVVWATWGASTPYRAALRLDVFTDGTVRFDASWYLSSGTTNPAPTAFEHVNLDGISFSVTA